MIPARTVSGGSPVRYFVLILLLAALTGCQSGGTQESTSAASRSVAGNKSDAAPAGDSFTGAVTETMNAGGYTYVLVDTGEEQVWAAGPQQTMEIGTRVVISKAMPMQGFRSETLERTFDVLYFVGGFEPEGDHEHPASEANPHGSTGMGDHGASGSVSAGAGGGVDLADIKAADQTVAVIYEQQAQLAGETVRVRGKVVKALSGIMGANWLHIQDGSGDAGTNDLTVTTAEVVPVGSTVVVEGVLGVDRDFGSGYKYDVIIENAKVTVE